MKFKIIFTLLAAFFLTSCDQAFSIKTDSEKVNYMAAEISDFDLPAGYTPDYTATVIGYDMAAYKHSEGSGHIYLIQSEDVNDWTKMTEALDEIVIGTSDPTTRLTVIENRQVTVRGLETILVISEAINSEGLVYKQAAVGFQGNGGPALLVLSEPMENWDEDILNNLLASIH